MKINTTDPDMRTIFSRIKEGSLDLQPDFQRAEVWKIPKKKLLIDTILRGWQVPPVHVILNDESYIQEVLDGQQRLSAIRDFMSDDFKVDGKIEPLDDDILSLDGLTYSKLPEKVKNRFDRSAIRVFEIVEYNQGEPGELFNRLNESLKLTSAEKRNAYVGELRKQIKSLVTYLDECGLDKSFLGFSNQRMAYHDMFIKLCYMLEKKSIIASYTEKQLNDRARDDTPFNDSIIESVKDAIFTLKVAKDSLDLQNETIHVTKATLISWLYFLADQIARNNNVDKTLLINSLSRNFIYFEVLRNNFRLNNEIINSESYGNVFSVRELLGLFNVRSVSRVMTAGSLLIRDFIISIFSSIHDDRYLEFQSYKKSELNRAIKIISDIDSNIDILGLIDNYSDKVIVEGEL
ncbi:DUF262 domain-containing protein [Aeromonas hydrophila]|uniref:DUF262 domain-containing protein n=1 Tax=Aeromonas hydrophila TaxID=644 RepID=UPI0038D099FA